MTVWGVDERICVQRPPLLLGMCALEHARVKHVRYLCVSAGSSLLPCRPEKADGWDSLGLDLMFPKWEVAWGSDPKTLCLPYAFRPCPASVRSLSYFASFGVLLSLLLCVRMGAHHCSWGSWAVKANNALGAQVWGRAAPLGFVPLVLPGHWGGRVGLTGPLVTQLASWASTPPLARPGPCSLRCLFTALAVSASIFHPP